MSARFVVVAALLWVGVAQAAEIPPLVPRPASLARVEGELLLPRVPGISVPEDASARVAAERLAALVQATYGVKPTLEPWGAIRLRRDARLKPEEYRLQVTDTAAIIDAAGLPGWTHGASSLWQLMRESRGRIVLPQLEIRDAPRFAWRGIMLDSARHYQTPAFIRSFIEWMAVHKLNVLHWHLTDDQAWRLEIRKYPRLTEVGAWRVPAGAAARADLAGDGSPRKYGGFYSRETVREIVRFAADRGITVVPEIEMPGHVTAAAVAYPWLSASPDPPREVPSDWGVYPDAYALDERTFGFVEDVLREVMELFPGRWIHVGGDEVETTQWKASPAAQARMRELGTRDPKRLQVYFTQRVARFLAAHGRRLVGWDEILEPGLPQGAVVMSWRGVDGALAAAAKGHDTILAAHPTLYFDNRQSPSRDEPPGRVRVVSLEDVYRFDPMPQSIAPARRKHVLGLQGNLWTEHVRTEARAAVMAFPRAAAVAELGWSPAEYRAYPDFRRRLDALLDRYESIGLGEAAVRQRMREKALPAPDKQRRTAHELALCSENIALVLEDDGPVGGGRAAFPVDIRNPCWIWRAAPLAGAGAIEVRVGQVPFNFQIGEEVHKIRFPKPATPEGELEVRVGSCEGPLAARLPLAPALEHHGVTTLPRASLPRPAADADLCLRFAQPALEPLWVVDSVELHPGGS
jgi:hexosaminidase